MRIKICFNNETHKLSNIPSSFSTLTKIISSLFLSELPQSWNLEYVDSEGDRIMLADEQDYKEFIDSELGGSNKSTGRVFIVPKQPVEESQVFSFEDIVGSLPIHPEGLQMIESNEKPRLNALTLEVIEKDVASLDEELERFKLESERIPSHFEWDFGKENLDFKEKLSLPLPAESFRFTLDANTQLTKCIDDYLRSHLEKPETMEEPQIYGISKFTEPMEAPRKGKKFKGTRKMHEKEPTEKIQDESKPKVISKPKGKGKGKPKAKHVKSLDCMSLLEEDDFDERVTKAVQRNIAKIASMTQSYMVQNATSQEEVPIKPKTTVKSKVQDMHYGVRCDGCQKMPIPGIRYKCSICGDFDYCELCEQTIEHPHAFLKIKSPSQPFSHFLHLSDTIVTLPSPAEIEEITRPKCPIIRFIDTSESDVTIPQLKITPIQESKSMINCESEAKISKPLSPCGKKKVTFQEVPDVAIIMESKEETPTIVENKESLSNVIPQDCELKEEKREEKTEKTKKSLMKKKLIFQKQDYSWMVRDKAKQLKELLPETDIDVLLSFVANAPDDLDVLELMENLKL